MKSVEQNLLAFFKENHSRSFPSGELEKLGFTGTNGKIATGSTVTRKLRNLAEDGSLKVEYGAQHHAHYSLNTEVVQPKLRQVIEYTKEGTVKINYLPC